MAQSGSAVVRLACFHGWCNYSDLGGDLSQQKLRPRTRTVVKIHLNCAFEFSSAINFAKQFPLGQDRFEYISQLQNISINHIDDS